MPVNKVLFMTPNVWRMKPWSVITLPQPWKGLISFVLTIGLGYILALICVKIAPAWLPMEDVIQHLPAGDKGIPPFSVVPRRGNRRVHPHPVPDLASLF
ncbi:MAG: hypothetical protein KKD99_11975 [Proteobacteria bacterium]|nr:hypothetical protein [Pseudomonadota bacterium]MBU4354601.1 hypothetical protein [Pseudomonadota bacterium]MBU4449293.1 hypothetical protein [Pseudomonadota bacterium]MCG2773385.1 hypothetical protein [Desulfobacterales bacterium]